MSDPLISYILVWLIAVAAFAIWMVSVVRHSVKREEELRRGKW